MKKKKKVFMRSRVHFDTVAVPAPAPAKCDLKSLIKEGKSELECVEELLKSDESISAGDAVAAYKSALRSSEAANLIDADAESKKAADAIEAQAKILAEKALEKIEMDGVIEKAIATGKVFVKENPNQWKVDQLKMFKSLANVNKYGAGHESAKDVSELMAKFKKAWAEKAGLRTDSDPVGGNWVRPEFDEEVDLLVRKKSQLLDAIGIRRGTDKTEINGMTNFAFTDRATQNDPFAEEIPPTQAEEVLYRETGAIVSFSPYMLTNSEHNLVDNLIELAANAKIEHLEARITTGKISDGNFFDGIRFQSGVTAFNIAAAGGTGLITSKDLTNATLAASDITAANGVFIMDRREAFLLGEERNDENQPIKTVRMQADGSFVHEATGTKVVISNLMSRINTALTSNAGGLEVGCLFGDLSRFRIYQDGPMDVAQTDQFKWSSNQVSMRFILRYKFAIPANSLTSFVTLQGVKNNLIV